MGVPIQRFQQEPGRVSGSLGGGSAAKRVVHAGTSTTPHRPQRCYGDVFAVAVEPPGARTKTAVGRARMDSRATLGKIAAETARHPIFADGFLWRGLYDWSNIYNRATLSGDADAAADGNNSRELRWVLRQS